MNLSIVIPCYNEAESIELLINKLLKILNREIEIILVNNGSIDNTISKLEALSLPNNIKVLTLEHNLGYGNGIIQGLKKTSGEIVSWTHADLQTDPMDVVEGYYKFKEELIEKQCIVKGNRRKRKLKDEFITLGMSIYSSIMLGTRLFDINAQPKLFHRSFIDLFSSPPLDFSLDLYVLYFFKKQNIKVRTIPVYFENRIHGEAKGGGSNIRARLKIIINTIIYAHKLKKHKF